MSIQNILCAVCVFFLSISGTIHCIAQERGSNGVIVDENSLPVIGATVKVKNTFLGTTTDEKGHFNLTNTGREDMLLISFVGKKTVEINAGNDLRVVLYPSDLELETAVVQVAYGSQRNRDLTGAVGITRSEAIGRRPVTSVTAALEGTMPGVVVNNTYGQPGNSPEIRIRGFSSVNGVNDPLYVVDGVPFAGDLAEVNPDDVESVSVLKDASAAALYGNRAANGVILITRKKARTRQLSLEFNVRQGLYLRGMKEYECTGTDDFMEAMWKSHRNSLLTSKPKDYPTVEAANAEASRTLIDNILKYNIYNLPNDQLFDAEGNLAEGAAVREAIREDLDWFSPLERKGYRQEYTLSGGAVHDKSDYHVSMGYLNEEGFLKNAGFNRLTARLQVNLTPKPWLGGGINLSGSHQNQRITEGTVSSYLNPFYFSRNMAPIYPVHLHDLTTGEYVLDGDGNRLYDDGTALERPQYSKRNIVQENEINSNNLTKSSVGGQAYADVKLPAGFTFTLKGNLYLSGQDRKEYYDPESGESSKVGKIYRSEYNYKQYSFQQQLNWQRQFGNHRAEVLLAHENYYYGYDYSYLSKSDQIMPGNTSLSNFTSMQKMLGYPQDYKTESYLGRVRYQYGGRYFAEAAFRRDGSSRFHPDYRWGNFGSFGLGWIVSEESFLKEAGWIDFLKLRFSYGEVGNDASANYYAWMALYRITTNGGDAALYKSQNVARNIKWETTASYDGALEATLFGRWNFTVEYFDKRSKDLLFDVTLPLSAGATSTDASLMAYVTRNLGNVSNRGWEISTDVDVIRSRGWRWNVGTNATFLKNKILTLPPENRQTGIIVPGQNQKYMEGHSVYEWWLPVYAGVDRLTGNSLYLADTEQYSTGGEPEGDKKPLPKEWMVKIGENYYTTNTTYARKDWCGSALPKMYGNFSTRLQWKGFDLSALLTYSVGGKVYDKSYSSLMSVGVVPNALHRDILKSWDKAPEGMTEESPDRLDASGTPAINKDLSIYNNAISSRFLTDGSYLWIKNIAASYTLSGAFVEKLDLQSIRLSVSLENIAMFTKRQGMNPQQSFRGDSQNVLVAPKVYTLGLTIKL